MGDTSNSIPAPSKYWSTLAALIFVISAITFVTQSESVSGLNVPGGTITGNVTWTLSDSPVDLEGNLTIETGASLTIQPGVLVLMEDHNFLGVNGTLRAEGTSGGRIKFEGSGSAGFDRINVTSGGEAYMTFCDIDSTGGVLARDSGTEVRIYNSTITSTLAAGLTAQYNSEAWLINCTFNSPSNVSVILGTVHEGYWFSFKAMKDNGEGPYTQGADLTIFASNPQGSSFSVYDSTSGDPKTGPDGTIPAFAIEQYLHEGSVFSNRVKMTITMSADNSRWRKQENEWVITKDTDYVWWMDFTPPEAPTNLSVLRKGGHWIHVQWDYPGDDSKLSNFVLQFKKSWEGESEWDTAEPSASSRDWNITVEEPPNPVNGLLEERDYVIRLYAVDGSENPSDTIGPITVKTLDITKPSPPEEIEVIVVEGTYVNIQWNRSVSEDVVRYGIMVEEEGEEGELIFVPSDGNDTQIYNLTGLESETEYTFEMAAFDDGEIPNNSTWTEPKMFRTLDITPPEKPSLSLSFLEPDQYINGSGYYNGSQVALEGFVPGENRTFIDVFLNGELYVNPNPELPRPSTFEGRFFFFISVDEIRHNIRVRSVDPAGNKGPLSEEVSIIIDRTDPLIGLEMPDNGVFTVDNDDMVEIDSNSTDDNSIHSITWYIEKPDGTVETESGSTLSKVFPLGNYNITLEVFDLAGNMNKTLFKVRSLVPDDTAPVATVLSPSSNVDIDLAPIFEVEFSEEIVWDLISAGVERTEGEGTGSIDVLSTFDRKNLTGRFELTRSLEGGVNYTFFIESIMDTRGNIGENIDFGFRTIDDNRVDTDKDGIPDYYEVQKGFLSPSIPDDASEDEDEDGLTNLQEYLEGTDPASPDSDGDGMTDGWEVEYGLKPMDRSDALSDADGDSYSNLEEFRSDTDPNDKESKPTASEEDDILLIVVIIIIAVVLLLIIILSVFFVIRSRKRKEEMASKEEEEEEEEGPRTWSEQVEESMRECPSCGAALEEGLDYCPMCGATLEIEKEEDLLMGTMDEESIMGEDDLAETEIEEEPPEEDTIPSESEGVPELDDDMAMNEPPSV